MGSSTSKDNPITPLNNDSPLFGSAYDSQDPNYDCLPTSKGANDYKRWNGKTCFGRKYPKILDHENRESYETETQMDSRLIDDTGVNGFSPIARFAFGTSRTLMSCQNENVNSNWGWNKSELDPSTYPRNPSGVCENLPQSEFSGLKYAIPITYGCSPQSYSNWICVPDFITSEGCRFGVACAKSEWDENRKTGCCLGQINDFRFCAPTWSDKAYAYEECESGLSNFCMNSNNWGNEKCNDFCSTKTLTTDGLRRRTDNSNSFCFNYAKNYCTTGNNMVLKSFCRDSVSVETKEIVENNKKRPGYNSSPKWADDFMFGVANSGGYCLANQNTTNSLIARYCSCYSSDLLNPACTDTDCVNYGYKIQDMYSYSRTCPTICQTVINNNNNTRTNITYYDTTFINDCGGEDKFNSFYDLSGGVCVLQDGGRFRNDPTCTNENNGPSPGDIVKSPLFLPILIGGIVIVVVIIIVVIVIFGRKNVKNPIPPGI